MRQAIDAAEVPLAIVTAATHLLYVNRAAARVLGNGTGQNDDALRVATTMETPGASGPVALAFRQRGRQRGRQTFLFADGSRVDLECAVTPLLEEGEAAAVLVELRPDPSAGLEEDTPAARSSSAGQSSPEADSEARYRAVLHSIDQGFFTCEVILDDQGTPVDYRFLETNDVFEQLTGIENAAGRTARELVPDLESKWFQIYGNVALTGKPTRFREGSQAMGRWFDVYAFPIGGDASLQVAALFTNITERVRAEQEREELVRALELERTRLSTLFHEAPAAIATLRGPEHVFEMVNPLYHELVGNRQVIGKSAREAFPELAEEELFDLLDGVYETGRPFVGRGIRIELRHGPQLQPQEHFVDFVYQPLRDPDGAIAGIFVHAVDVTAHKRAVEELARAHDLMERRVEERTAELRRLNAELESFNYSVSHDLRAPLRGIDGFSQVLLEDYSAVLDSAGRHYLERIQAGTARMAELIDDLLDLSQVSRTEVARRPVDVTELARGVARELQERQRDDHPEIEIRVEDDMTTFADPSLLRIVFVNLLENALKFSGRRRHGHVEVVSRHDAGEQVFLVRDNGAGFSMDYADKLFVPFQRLHADEEYSGTGIGLATVQRIIHKHGGRIWATGAPNEGATFYFTLTPPERSGQPATAHRDTTGDPQARRP